MKRSSYKIGGYILIALGAAVLFGWLIIFVTPYLYKHHPYTTSNDNAAAPKPTSLVLHDTLKISGDTLICRSKILGEEEHIDEPTSPTIGDLGTFGDSAGFWNAIFSALAMIFVVITLIHQSHKDDNDDERARLAQFQEQCLTMLSLLSEIVSQLRIPQKTRASFDIDSNEVIQRWNGNQEIQSGTRQRQIENSINTDITGRACFKYIYDERPEGRNIRDYISKYYENPNEVIATEELYESLKKITETYFDHYFRTIYRIFKFIKESDLGDIDQKKQDSIRELCADLVRAQLSTYELAILYYNGLYPKYRKTSKAIYEHYCLFDNLSPSFLLLRSEIDYYNDVQIHHLNGESYDPLIHYHCSAFTKPRQDSSSQKGKRWYDICKIRRHKRKSNDSNSIGIDLSEVEIKVYNALKSISGQTTTIKHLINLSKVSEKTLKKALRRFEREKIITISNGRNGNKYAIIKELNVK